jgi:hypothetical protein
MSSTRVTYTPRPDATPEGELHNLAQVYKFVLAKQRAAGRAAPNDVRKDQDAHTAKSRVP